ncbi:fumarylacetoacetate hydrolase family protein [Agromyces sp. SYSU T00266]|uniref:fumarylacetoacetate hydrolase family protein n=1 Tax=Agromyces zhanjiangensis TaxID=3158562 RepID=UPI00339928FB
MESIDWEGGLGLGRAIVRGEPRVVLRRADQEESLLAVVDGRLFADVPELLEATGGDIERIQAGPREQVRDDELLSPVGAPRKILCTGRNYLDHVREAGHAAPPETPELFAKWATSLSAPYADIALPVESNQIDFESELAVVIGRRVRRVTPDDAADAVFGYTVASDGSVRDWQFRSQQATAGKGWDGLTPLGPVIVPVGGIGARPDLLIEGVLNGDVLQSDRTSGMLIGVPELVSFASTFVTLEPGDILLTGTPAGVGAARTPPRYLTDGAVFEARIEGIGSVRNRYVAEEPV